MEHRHYLLLNAETGLNCARRLIAQFKCISAFIHSADECSTWTIVQLINNITDTVVAVADDANAASASFYRPSY